VPVVEAIVARFTDIRGILEIGPGPGVLTGPLSLTADRLVAIELDEAMGRLLPFAAPKAELRMADALQMDLAGILGELPSPRAVVSNLPYYITGPLLTKIAEARQNLDKAVLMMQKEVADRVMALPGNSNRGSLSVYLQAQFEIEKVCAVPAACFLPPPKVDSTVLEFRPKPDLYSDEFFRLVRLGFAQPRKTLINNLVAGRGVNRAIAADWVAALGVKETVRPAELTHEDWLALAVAIKGS
jgi:16S rRNA (adenine1518-N6/adenine1519-N6)-dimethyltransferase